MVSQGDIESKGSNKSISTYLVLHTQKKRRRRNNKSRWSSSDVRDVSGRFSVHTWVFVEPSTRNRALAGESILKRRVVGLMGSFATSELESSTSSRNTGSSFWRRFFPTNQNSFGLTHFLYQNHAVL